MINQQAARFITGDGEMSALMRNKDWSKSSIGEIDTWPQSLLTTLNIMLNSKFPMFLFWGPELICFYNDAYRPSLGKDGKHPQILGSRAEDYWQEIWTVIKPLIEQVLAGGEATWAEDQLIPIYRNGKMEDVYWTFSHSAVNDESGKPFGVFVTCSETTGKVVTIKKLEESEQRSRLAIEAAEIGTFDWDLITNEFIGSQRLNEIFGFPAQADITHKILIDALHVEDKPQRDAAINNALANGSVSYEARINWPDKSIHWVKIFGKIKYENQQPLKMYGTAIDITESKNTFSSLQESELRFRNVANNAPVLIWMAGIDKGCNFFNKAWLNFTGRTEDEEKGNGWVEGVHPEDVESCMKIYINAFDKREEFYMEYRLKRFDGNYRWISDNGIPRFTTEDIFEGYIGACLDIEDEKLAEEQIQKSELHFKTISNVSPVGLWMTDVNGENIFVNDTWIAWTGDPLEKQLGTGWLNRVVEEDKKDAPAKFMDSMQRRTKYIDEFRITRPDGTLQWCLTEGSPFYNIHGNFAGYAGSVTDITERKLVQKELERKVKERTMQLKESEERNFRMINEVQDYAILLLSREGIIVNWNKGAETIKGYKEAEAVGNHFSIFYTKQDLEKKLPNLLIEKAIKTGMASDEGWRLKKDGSTFWASVVITALHDSNNNIIGFSKVTRDLTERKKAEEKLAEANMELKRANMELEKSNNELEQFAYVASHDLQEPLRKIRVFTERLEDSMKNVPGPSKDYYLRIRKASERMDTLIKDLLEFSRLSESNELFVDTDLNGVIKNILSDFELLIHEKNAVLEIAPLPVIDAVPLQMQQLFYNLLSNALKFSRKETPPLIKMSCKILNRDEVISHSLDEHLQYFLIEIQDNGIGFDHKYQEQIFVIFQRLNDLHTYGGTGIGLALCKKIVLNHNGIIYATGNEGEGARFSIILPKTNHHSRQV